MRLIIADDHPFVREAVGTLIEPTEIEIVAEARSSDEVINVVNSVQADVLLFDIAWVRQDAGIEFGFTILGSVVKTNPDLRVLVYTMHDRPDFKRRCRDLGAKGYVLKGILANKLIDALRHVDNGGEIWSD